MHAYRDALINNGKSVKWVVALYPGDKKKLLYQDKKDEFSVGWVGVIPLKPSEKPREKPDESKLSCFLEEILNDKSDCKKPNE